MPFNKYLQKLRSVPTAEATEHTHRPALQALLEAFASKGQRVLHEPKRERKFGSPDFKITQTETIVGYVENKKLGENLDKTLKSEQIKKYQSLSGNLLITNYLEWIWLREGKVQQRESLVFATDLEYKNAASARQAAVRNLRPKTPRAARRVSHPAPLAGMWVACSVFGFLDSFANNFFKRVESCESIVFIWKTIAVLKNAKSYSQHSLLC